MLFFFVFGFIPVFFLFVAHFLRPFPCSSHLRYRNSCNNNVPFCVRRRCFPNQTTFVYPSQIKQTYSRARAESEFNRRISGTLALRNLVEPLHQVLGRTLCSKTCNTLRGVAHGALWTFRSTLDTLNAGLDESVPTVYAPKELKSQGWQRKGCEGELSISFSTACQSHETNNSLCYVLFIIFKELPMTFYKSDHVLPELENLAESLSFEMKLVAPCILFVTRVAG